MSCPDWTALLAAREAEPAIDPPGWAAARRHLDHCRSCRETALAHDPTLVFARLPAVAVAPDEVARMRQAVAVLRRTAARSGRGRRRQSWRRLAVAAGLALAVLGLQPLAGPPVGRGPKATPDSAGSAPDRLAEVDAWTALPVVEELSAPDARVYEIGAEGLAVVMIVDASLDV